MSGFNKVTSFVLGLIVVLVFLFVFGSRVDLSDKLLAFKDTNVTPTHSTSSGSATPTPIVKIQETNSTKKKGFFESLFGRKMLTATPTPTAKPPSFAEAPKGKQDTNNKIQETNNNESKITKVVEDNTKGALAGTTNTETTFAATQPKTIPQTGPALLFPIFVSAFGIGMFLRKKS